MGHLSKATLRALMLTLMVGGAANCMAQATYSYDAAGNRISAKVVVISTAKSLTQPQKHDSLDDDIYLQEYEIPVEDVVAETSIKIYPNPTKGMLRVDIENADFTKQCQIDVYDGVGRKVAEEANLSESNIINLSNKPSGTYIMRITLGSETTTWQIIKE